MTLPPTHPAARLRAKAEHAYGPARAALLAEADRIDARPLCETASDPARVSVPAAELARLRAVEGAARHMEATAREGRLTIAFTTALDNLTATLSAPTPDPRDEEIRRLREALTAIAARDTGAIGLDPADPYPYDGMDASDGYAAGLADADRVCAEMARAALTPRSEK